jgi:D-ribulokinase
MEANQTYIGVDVGTTSARAAIFDHKGTMLAKSATPITVFRPKADHYEHSSEEIWKSVCSSVQNVLKKSRANVANVRGVGFDATCSLVVLGQNDQPLTVSVTGSPEQNVILFLRCGWTTEPLKKLTLSTQQSTKY